MGRRGEALACVLVSIGIMALALAILLVPYAEVQAGGGTGEPNQCNNNCDPVGDPSEGCSCVGTCDPAVSGATCSTCIPGTSNAGGPEVCVCYCSAAS
jgi:hypothetical protein